MLAIGEPREVMTSPEVIEVYLGSTVEREPVG
jgi:ABC-type branched-subunit amino acid transport system ATPase component